MEQKLKCCKKCGQLKPIFKFRMVRRKHTTKEGKEVIYENRSNECSVCMSKRVSQLQREAYHKAKKQETEYYNYEGVKCKIEHKGENNYRVSTDNINMHYTHLVGLSGTLEVNKSKYRVNADNFINKTYEHRMLLFKEICNLQNEINLNKELCKRIN